MVISGQLPKDLEVQASASQAWELIGTLELSNLIQQALTDVIDKIDVLQGDGEAGTIIKITFAPGVPGPKSQTDKFTTVDNEKLVKEVETIEGGYLELGFTLLRFRGEIVKSSSSSCIIKTTIDYALKDDAAANVSLVAAHPFAKIAEFAKNSLENKNN